MLWMNLSHPTGPRSYFKPAGFRAVFQETASWLACQVGGAGKAGWGRVDAFHPGVNNANRNLALVLLQTTT